MGLKSYLRLIKAGDVIIVIFLVISVVVSSGWYWFGENMQNERVVIVEVEGELVKELEFPPEGEEKNVTVDVPKGEATIELQDNRVRVRRMPTETCPRGICADTGWISHTGETIACVPNRMIVFIQASETTEREIDGVTG